MKAFKVSMATLGGPIHTPHTGQIGPKLVLEEQRQKGRITNMEVSDGFLFVTADKTTLAIPVGYVTHMTVIPTSMTMSVRLADDQDEKVQ